MPRSRAFVATVALVAGLTAVVAARPPAQAVADPASRPWIVLVDDLHLDFRNTGRVRAAVTTVLRPLFDAARLVAVTSSGPSSLRLEVPPGATWGTVGDAVKRITGNALKPGDIIQARDARELAYRARQTRLAFEALLRGHGERPIVLLVSNGYRSDVPEVSAQVVEISVMAGRSGVAIVALDPQHFDALPPDPRVSPAALDQHRQATAASLERLAQDTGGTMWRVGDDFISVLSRLR